MNNLSVSINNHDIAVKEYHGKRVITFKDIDECHGRPQGTAGRTFRENRQHLVEGTDYFKVCPDEIRRRKIMEVSGKAREDIALITESGYLMLVKSFTDDLAWQVQRALVNSYFGKPAVDETARIQASQERAHAMLLNAQNRTYKTIMQTIHDKRLSAIAAQVFGITALEVAFGQKVDFRPECEQTYSATEIGQQLGISANMVGKIANAHGLKTDEYGITVLDKSPYSNKEIPNFRYYAKVIPALRAVLVKTDA